MYNKTEVMRRAWQIKREDPRNIFGLCLAMAWAEAKEKTRMKGTPKQIEWASNIIYGARRNCELLIERGEWDKSMTTRQGYRFDTQDVEIVRQQLENGLAVFGNDAAKVIEKRDLMTSERIQEIAANLYFKRTGTRF